MSVLPGSLDYLYHNNIIDHIPYEAYSMTPMTYSGYAQMSGVGTGYANGIDYLNSAKNGLLYNTYTHPDVFVHRDPYFSTRHEQTLGQKFIHDGQEYGRGYDMGYMINGEDGRRFNNSFSNTMSSIGDKISRVPNWLKGLVGVGIVALTVRGLCKGANFDWAKIKNSISTSKINPKNWFHKK